mmetsp:Transcript_39856/g.104378  ORF Transcript_39856/g.104378 Transcript_39856/m.104378 type:complete len:476 (+) Transcript_39856:287-1714(+)
MCLLPSVGRGAGENRGLANSGEVIPRGVARATAAGLISLRRSSGEAAHLADCGATTSRGVGSDIIGLTSRRRDSGDSLADCGAATGRGDPRANSLMLSSRNTCSGDRGGSTTGRPAVADDRPPSTPSGLASRARCAGEAAIVPPAGVAASLTPVKGRDHRGTRGENTAPALVRGPVIRSTGVLMAWVLRPCISSRAGRGVAPASVAAASAGFIAAALCHTHCLEATALPPRCTPCCRAPLARISLVRAAAVLGKPTAAGVTIPRDVRIATALKALGKICRSGTPGDNRPSAAGETVRKPCEGDSWCAVTLARPCAVAPAGIGTAGLPSATAERTGAIRRVATVAVAAGFGAVVLSSAGPDRGKMGTASSVRGESTESRHRPSSVKASPRAARIKSAGALTGVVLLKNGCCTASVTDMRATGSTVSRRWRKSTPSGEIATLCDSRTSGRRLCFTRSPAASSTSGLAVWNRGCAASK